MRRLLRPALIAALAATMLLALSAGQALASPVSCGETITQDTKLDSDLINCPGTALTIGADNITLDLNGHTIGQQPPCCPTILGIDDTSHRGVVIENGKVLVGYAGIRLLDAHKTVLRDLDVQSVQSGTAIELSNSTENRLERSTVRRSEVAVSLDDSDQNVFRDSTINGYSRGVVIEAGSDFNRLEHLKLAAERYGPTVLIDGSSYNTVRENFMGTTFGGVGLSEADHNMVIGNTLSTEEVGIGLFQHSDANVVKDNVLHGGGDDKILLDESDQNLILHNDAGTFGSTYGISVWRGGSDNRIERNDTSNNETGIGVGWGARNVVTGNRANGSVGSSQRFESLGHGIFVGDQASGTLLSRNETDRNLADGIDLRDPTSVLIHNTANFNGDLGIEAVPGVTDGGGNRAFGNGNPLQCLNVACKTKK